jgi:hypothetical protein
MKQSKSNGNGNRHGATDEKVEISTKPISPNSKKVYVNGTQYPDIKVPFREIFLSTPNTVTGMDMGMAITVKMMKAPFSSTTHQALTPTRMPV